MIRTHDQRIDKRHKAALGRTEIEVTPTGSEGSTIHGLIWSRVDSWAIDEIVGTALAGGINWFDG